MTIRKWGTGLAIPLPRQVAEELHLEENITLECHVENGRLILEPTSKRQVRAHKYTLDELLAQITPENMHQEIATGHATGEEF